MQAKSRPTKMIKSLKTSSAKKMKSKLIAPCGMNCRLCRAYIRERNPCPGCNENDVKPACRFKTCAVKAAGKFKYCFSCDQFPCSQLQHLNKRYTTKYGMSMIANLETIRQFGMSNFIKRERERWKCVKCGEIICVHDAECGSCGHRWR